MATQTRQGSSAIQGPLWSARADDWARVQEPLMRPAFEAGLDALAITAKTRCSTSAADRGSRSDSPPTGAPRSADSTQHLPARHARRRIPGAPLVQGEIEEPPLPRRQLRRRHGLQLLPVRVSARRGARRGGPRRRALRPRSLPQLGAARAVRGRALPGRDRRAPAGPATRRSWPVRALGQRGDRPRVRRGGARRRLDRRRHRRLELPRRADRDRGSDGGGSDCRGDQPRRRGRRRRYDQELPRAVPHRHWPLPDHERCSAIERRWRRRVHMLRLRPGLCVWLRWLARHPRAGGGRALDTTFVRGLCAHPAGRGPRMRFPALRLCALPPTSPGWTVSCATIRTLLPAGMVATTLCADGGSGEGRRGKSRHAA